MSEELTKDELIRLLDLANKNIADRNNHIGELSKQLKDTQEKLIASKVHNEVSLERAIASCAGIMIEYIEQNHCDTLGFGSVVERMKINFRGI